MRPFLHADFRNAWPVFLTRHTPFLLVQLLVGVAHRLHAVRVSTCARVPMCVCMRLRRCIVCSFFLERGGGERWLRLRILGLYAVTRKDSFYSEIERHSHHSKVNKPRETVPYTVFLNARAEEPLSVISVLCLVACRRWVLGKSVVTHGLLLYNFVLLTPVESKVAICFVGSF